MDGHYDRNADVAWIRLDGWDPGSLQVEETERGLVEREKGSGRILGLEFWAASEQLPEALLEALPTPPARETAIERQPS